jgi:hypothetical protein
MQSLVKYSKVIFRYKVIVTLLIVLINADVFSLTARDIMKKVDSLGNYKTSAGQYAMIVYPNMKNSKSYRIIKMIGYSKGKDISFNKYVHPNSAKGIKMLIRGDDIWMYWPSSGRKRKIASYSKKKSVEGIGGDFSYQDMTRGDMDNDYSSRILSQDAKTWTIELIPKKRYNAYKKLIVIVKKELYHITQINYYDDGGFLKSLFLLNYKSIKGYYTPMTATMVNYRRGSKTIFKIVKIVVDIPVKNGLFDSNRLDYN